MNQPTDRSPSVPQQVKKVLGEAEHLRELARDLAERLTYVAQLDDKNKVAGSPPPETKVPIMTELFMIENVLDQTSKILQDVTARLEV